MIYTDKAQFMHHLPPQQARIMCLDIGQKRIGIAIAHRGLGMPLQVLHRINRAKDIAALRGIIAEWKIGGIVVGMPIAMDGSRGEATKEIEAFIKWLLELNLPIITHDERMSTAAAHSLMRSHAVCRKTRHANDDMIAASMILESFVAT